MRKTIGIDLSRQRALAAVATADDVRITYDDDAVVGLDGDQVVVGSRAVALGERDRCDGFFAELGRPEPFIVSGAPYGAEALVAELMRAAVDGSAVGEVDGIALAFPDELNAYQLDLLAQAARLAGVGEVHFVPNAVALSYASASTNGSQVAEGAARWLLQTDRSPQAGAPAPTGTSPATRVLLLGAGAGAGAIAAGAGIAAASTTASGAAATGMGAFGAGKSVSDFAEGQSMSDFGSGGKEMGDFGGGRSMGDFATPKPGRTRILVGTAATVVVVVVAALLLRGGDEQPVVQTAASEPTTTTAAPTTTVAPAPPPASGAFAVNATVTAINTPPGSPGAQPGQTGAGTLNLICEGTSCRGSVFSPSLQLAPVAFTGTIVDGVLTSSVESPITGECPGTMTETVKLTFDGDRVTGEASESPNPERCPGRIHVSFTYTFEGTRTA